MTNEAVLVDRFSEPINMACNETAMEKGSIVVYSDGREVKLSSSDNDKFAGILRREKIAGDGRTQCAVFVDGVFDMKVDTACAIGDDLVISGPNVLKKYTSLDREIGQVVGRAMEDVTGADTIHVMVGR